MISEQEVQELVAANIALLDSLKWEQWDDHRLRTRCEKFTLFLNSKGIVHVWKGSVLLVETEPTEDLVSLYVLKVKRYREDNLEELAECFRPGHVPAGLEML